MTTKCECVWVCVRVRGTLLLLQHITLQRCPKTSSQWWSNSLTFSLSLTLLLWHTQTHYLSLRTHTCSLCFSFPLSLSFWWFFFFTWRIRGWVVSRPLKLVIAQKNKGIGKSLSLSLSLFHTHSHIHAHKHTHTYTLTQNIERELAFGLSCMGNAGRPFLIMHTIVLTESPVSRIQQNWQQQQQQQQQQQPLQLHLHQQRQLIKRKTAVCFSFHRIIKHLIVAITKCSFLFYYSDNSTIVSEHAS